MTENNDNDNPEDTTPLSTVWLVEKGDLAIGSDEPGQVHMVIGETRSLFVFSIEDARELFTHALAHMGGVTDRADTAVAEVAMELCKHHADMRERTEKRLAKLEGDYALQARHLGEYMGRLKQYE